MKPTGHILPAAHVQRYAAYLREHPGVTNKAKIARDLNMDRTTVQRYYDEIRAELRGEESPVPQT